MVRLMVAMSFPQRISVIMPVFNAAERLKESVGSVLAEAELPLELICVDDGSTDASGSLLEEMAAKDDRLRLIRQENAGPGAARNRGLELLTGDFFTFADADDVLEPGYLRELYETAVSMDADAVVSGWTRVDRAGGRSARSLCETPAILPPGAAALNCLPRASWGRLYRRVVLERSQARFPLEVFYGEDTAFNCLIDSFCKIIVLHPATGYLYRDEEGSVSNTRLAETLPGMMDALAWLAAEFRRRGMSALHRELLAGYAAHALRRIRARACHGCQRDCARRAAEILHEAGVSEADFSALRAKDARCLSRILAGGSGLSLGYYWKRLHRVLRGR